MEWHDQVIPASLAEAPLSFEWLGPDKHIGPVESETPLLVKLKNKTTNGTVALAAATATWGFLRLGHHLDMTSYLKFSEAAFLQMPNPSWIDISEVKSDPVPTKPSAVSAAKRLRRLLMAALNPIRWGKTIDQPFRETFHIVHLVRHVLDSSAHADFDGWLETAVSRIDKIAKRPPEQERDWHAASADELANYIRLFRGAPIAPLVFSEGLAPDQLADAFAEYSSRTRIEANPYIRHNQALQRQ